MSSIFSQYETSRVSAVKGKVQAPAQIVSARGEVGEIFLYGIVGFEEFGGTSASRFVSELKKLDRMKKISIHINSPGGDVQDGLAIYNQLSLHPAEKTVYVDGEASSIASVVAMAGDRVVMFPESTIMIHEARVLATAGTAADLRKTAEKIEAASSSIRDIYVRKTGMEPEKIMELMAAETTMNGPQALELKFADLVEEPKKRPTSVQAVKTNLSPIEVARLRAQLAARR